MQNIMVTASWDRTLKYWDGRSPNPVHTLQLTERAYALDVTFPLMVVGTADRNIMIYNLNNPTVPFKVFSILFDLIHSQACNLIRLKY